MDDKERPYKIIERLVDERSSLNSAQVLAELTAFEPLPDENDEVWGRRETWEHAYLLVALAELAAMHRLRPAVRLLLERACYGDPGEMMRGLRHTLEGIYEPDWVALAETCIELAESTRPGTRLWAVNQLGALREPIALEAVLTRLHDAADQVRSEAILATQMICDANPNLTGRATAAMREASSRFPSDTQLRRAMTTSGNAR